MSKLTLKSRLFHLAALIGIVAVSSAAGCGEGAFDETASAEYALTGNAAGPYDTTSGTLQSPGSNRLTPVTKIVGYGNGAYIFGIRLYWGTSSVLYGQTGGATGDTLSGLDVDPVTTVNYLDSSTILRGVKFTTSTGRSLEVGLTPATTTAFSNPDALFTDLQVWKLSVGGKDVLAGMTFYYTTP